MKQCFYKKNVLFIFSQIIILVLIYSNIFSQETDIFLAEAVKLRDDNKTKECLKILKNAEKKDKNNPEILYEIALTYLKIDDIKERIYASDYLERAMKLDPENENYILTYAKLKKQQGFYDTAEKIFLKLCGIDSKNTEVLSEVAEIYLEKAIWHDRMKKVYSDSDAKVPVILRLDNFARDNFNRAKNLFNRVLEIEPENAEALYNLGRLYLYRKNWEKMQELFSEAVKSRPDFKDAHLFLGYTYYMQQDYENALKSFEEAKKYMNEDEFAVMESFDRVFHDGEEIDPSYWTKRNPSYLTGINLRQLEHYARIAYANLHYTKPKMDLPGWKAERGQVLIRLGYPKFVSRTIPEVVLYVNPMVLGDANVTSVSGRDITYITSKRMGDSKYFKLAQEIWGYDDFYLRFEDRHLNRDFTLECTSKGFVYDRIVAKTPEIYKDPFESIKLDFPYYTASFLNPAGTIDLEIYYSIPLSNIPAEKIKNINQAVFDQGVFLFDDNWKEVSRSVDLIMAPLSESLVNLTSAVQIRTNAGSYKIALEFKERNNIFFGQSKTACELPNFGEGLGISDIIIGIPAVQKSSLKGRAGENNILPRPSRTFSEKLLSIYFEIYNLNIDAGGTDFTVNISVKKTGKKVKGLIPKLFGGLVKLITGGKKASISASYDYNGSAKTEKINRTLDVSQLKEGSYSLIIDVVDKTAGKTCRSERNFKLGSGSVISKVDFVSDIDLSEINIDKTIVFLKEEIKKDKSNPKNFYNLALAYIKKGDIEHRLEAAGLLERALQLDPKNEIYLLTSARLKVVQNYIDDAKELYSKIIEKNPFVIEAYIGLVKIYCKEVVDYFNTKNINSNTFYGKRNKILYDNLYKNNLSDAEDLLKRVLQFDPMNEKAYSFLSVLYIELEQLEKLEELSAGAVSILPGYTEGYLFLAYVYCIRNKLKEAEKIFDIASGLMSEDETAKLNSVYEIPGFVQKKRKEIFNFKEDRKIYSYKKTEFPFYYAAFKGEQGFVYSEIYYEIPVSEISEQMLEGISDYDFEQKGVILNEEGELISEGSEKIYMPVQGFRKDIFSIFRLYLNPGRYNLKIEYKDTRKMFEGSGEKELELLSYEQDFHVSDLILGIQNQSELEFKGKAGEVGIIPVPSLKFKEDVIMVYFEAYNLTLKNGKSDFKVKTSVTRYGTKSGFKRMSKDEVNKIIGQKKSSISYTYDYKGNTRDETIFRSVDISSLEKGNYVITVEVTDKKTGKKAASGLIFVKE